MMLGLSKEEAKRLRDLQFDFNVKHMKIIEVMESTEIKRIDGIDENNKSAKEESSSCELS